MAELEWEPRKGARAYRVELLDAPGGKVRESHVVCEPRFTRAIGGFAEACAWFRVAVTVDGITWNDHVPDVVIVDGLPQPLSSVTWEPSGAPAYRLVARDETIGEIALKQPVSGPPAAVSWGHLDITHRYRIKVQEWRDNIWRDLHPYRPLLPPLEYALEPPSHDISCAGIDHLVAVRLSHAAAGGQHGERRSDAWWRERLALLVAWTLPSLAAADRLVVVADESVPATTIASLRTESEQPAAWLRPNQLVGFAERCGLAGEILAVTHVTAGDRVHRALDRRIREHATEFASDASHCRRVLRFPLMVRLDRARGEACFELSAVAQAYTVLRNAGDGAGALMDELLHCSRPHIDPRYEKRNDEGIAGIVRAWPGPNATAALHGELLGAAQPQRVRAAFGLAGGETHGVS